MAIPEKARNSQFRWDIAWRMVVYLPWMLVVFLLRLSLIFGLVLLSCFGAIFFCLGQWGQAAAWAVLVGAIVVSDGAGSSCDCQHSAPDT